jgi:hypothetical protein
MSIESSSEQQHAEHLLYEIRRATLFGLGGIVTAELVMFDTYTPPAPARLLIDLAAGLLGLATGVTTGPEH